MEKGIGIALGLFLVAFFFPGCATTSTSSSESAKEMDMKEQEIIVQRALDYIEGWYTADTDRLQRALSPHLCKRQIAEDGAIRNANKGHMIRVAKQGMGLRSEPEKARKDITVLDQTETMASIKIVSEDFVDYLHLVKSQGEWTIVNVLWDYLP